MTPLPTQPPPPSQAQPGLSALCVCSEHTRLLAAVLSCAVPLTISALQIKKKRKHELTHTQA